MVTTEVGSLGAVCHAVCRADPVLNQVAGVRLDDGLVHGGVPFDVVFRTRLVGALSLLQRTPPRRFDTQARFGGCLRARRCISGSVEQASSSRHTPADGGTLAGWCAWPPSSWRFGSLWLVGCSSGEGPPPPTPTSPPDSAAASGTLQCANGVSTSLRVLDVRPVLGVVALPVSPHTAPLATARLGDSGSPRLFAKSASVIKKGSTFSLQAVSPHGVWFSWNAQQGDPSSTRARVVDRCRGSSATRWLAFVGGNFNRPSCVTLVVKTASGRQRVDVGVGSACTGQSPPVGPSTP
jgi:hypothetical protein